MKSLIKITSILCLIIFSTSCVSTVIGVAAGTAVGVTKVVVTAPVKVGSAVVRAASDDDDEEEEED